MTVGESARVAQLLYSFFFCGRAKRRPRNLFNPISELGKFSLSPYGYTCPKQYTKSLLARRKRGQRHDSATFPVSVRPPVRSVCQLDYFFI